MGKHNSMFTPRVNTENIFSYVLITTATSYFFSIWLGFRIGPYRKAANVPHPHVYASRESILNAQSATEKRALYLFNAAQRAHHNILENHPTVLTGVLLTGLQYPKTASALGAAWIFGRIIYAIEYSSADEKNVDGSGRFWKGGFHLAATCQMIIMGLVGKMGWDMLRS